MKKFHVISGPYVKSKMTNKKIMLTLTFSLIPIILFAIYKNGIIPYINGASQIFDLFRVILFIIIGPLTTFTVETIYVKYILKKNKNELIDYIKNSYSYIPGLFISLVLPVNTPFFILIIASIIAVILGKMIYGGFGNNIFNPALLGILFVIIMYPTYISSSYLNSYELTISSATPLTNSSMINGIGEYNTLVSPYGNLFNFLFGFIPGAMGETCGLLCIIAFFVLSFKKIIKWKIPVFYVLTVFIMTYIIALINGIGIWYPIYQILSGGLLFGAVFMSTDPVTSPTTNFGQILEGIVLGILTVIIRFFSSSPEGVLISILTCNMFVFAFDKIGLRNNISKRRIWLIVLTTLAVIIPLFISYYMNNKKDYDFELISKQKIKDNTSYVVNQRGHEGIIKIKITMNNNIVIDYEVLEHNESEMYYKKIEESDYIDYLIKNQNKKIDTVSGATVSSTALKKALLNVIEVDKNER